jgi:hypothetical protein
MTESLSFQQIMTQLIAREKITKIINRISQYLMDALHIQPQVSFLYVPKSAF